jgi:hypothetical protein
MNPTLMHLINQGLIHGPRIPQYAQSIARGGQKVASKIPNWAQALQNRLFSTQAGVPQHLQKPQNILHAVPPTFAMGYAKEPSAIKEDLNPLEWMDISKSIADATGITKASESLGNKINSLFDKDIVETKKVKKKKKKKKQRLESKKKQRYMKEKEEPSIPEHDAEGGLVGMKKGGHAKKKKKGYAKKQRKRKHYMASGFVKMKKKKKYIT